MNLETDEVHLWLTQCSAITDPLLLHKYRRLLTSDELDRQNNYAMDKTRRQDLISRVLVRTALSRYQDIAASDWRFKTGEHGKPEISTPDSSLRFNLSHSKDYIVLAVTRDRDVGVDIEYMHRKSDTVAIAERYFSDSEIADLSTMPLETRKERFYDYWTLKEAYIKACGLGLAFSLARFGFHFDQNGRVDIRFYQKPGEKFAGKAEEWQFWRIKPEQDYRMALAMRCGQNTDVSISVFETVPLTTYSRIDLAVI